MRLRKFRHDVRRARARAQARNVRDNVHKRRAGLRPRCAALWLRFVALANLVVRNADWLIIKCQPIRAVIQEKSQLGAARRSSAKRGRRAAQRSAYVHCP